MKIITIFLIAIFSLLNQIYGQEPEKKLEKAKSGFFVISAIKTISGQKIENEFFDIHLKQNFGNFYKAELFGMGCVDIALAKTKDSEDDTSFCSELTEAGYSLNTILKSHGNNRLFIGPSLKIFNTIPYWGGHIGGLDVDGKLYTSYLTLGFLKKFIAESEVILSNQKKCTLCTYNIYSEFSITSDSKDISFLNNLRIKGGVLLPISKGEIFYKNISVRMVIEVPIGKPIPI